MAGWVAGGAEDEEEDEEEEEDVEDSRRRVELSGVGSSAEAVTFEERGDMGEAGTSWTSGLGLELVLGLEGGWQVRVWSRSLPDDRAGPRSPETATSGGPRWLEDVGVGGRSLS